MSTSRAVDSGTFAGTNRYMSVTRRLVVTSDAPLCVAVGPHGMTNPLFAVTAAGAEAAAGLQVNGTVAGGAGPSLSVTSTASNEDLRLLAKGTGVVRVEGDLTVTGAISSTVASSATTVTSGFVFDATTSGGTFGISASTTPLTYTLPTPAAALGKVWRLVIVDQPSVATTLTIASGRMVGQFAFADTHVTADSANAVGYGFTGIRITPTALPGDCIEIWGLTSDVLGFRSMAASPAGSGAFARVV